MQVAAETGQPITTTKTVVDGVRDAIVHALANGEEVRVRGLGTFAVETRAPRVARDVHRGEQMMLPQRTVPVFRPGVQLKTATDGIQP